MISKQAIERFFSAGDIILSGGNLTQFEVEEIAEAHLSIRPIASKNKRLHKLSYAKLDAVIDGYGEIDPERIVRTLQPLLKKRDPQLVDHTNETYLYGIAREYIKRRSDKDALLAEEISPELEKNLTEGATKQVLINAYERETKARHLCISHWGAFCQVCEMNFERIYGARGKGFIHVHHLIPLADRGGEYKVDPINDLRPVCPNCHAMLHRGQDVITIAGLKALMQASGNV